MGGPGSGRRPGGSKKGTRTYGAMDGVSKKRTKGSGGLGGAYAKNKKTEAFAKRQKVLGASDAKQTAKLKGANKLAYRNKAQKIKSGK